MTPPRPHLTSEELARLVDAEPDALETGELRAHLARCRSCMAAYAEAVRLRAAHLRGQLRHEASAEIVDLGRRIARAPSPASGRRAWAWRAGLAAAAVVSALLVVVPRGGDRSSSLSEALIAPVQTALVEESRFGLVYPGAEEAPAVATPVLRAGERDASLTPVLLDLTRRSSRQPNDPELHYWLTTGQLADDNLPAAEHSLRLWQECCPEDSRRAVLAAVLAYRLNDLSRAHRILEEALERSPDDPLLRFDLSVVLVALERRPEAVELLRGLGGIPGDVLLGDRARALLESIEER